MNNLALEEERRDYAMKRIYGVEKDGFLARICKSYMVVIGDGKFGVVVDSLYYPSNWKSNNINLNSFDMILTNLPFGKNVKIDKDIAKQFMSNKCRYCIFRKKYGFII